MSDPKGPDRPTAEESATFHSRVKYARQARSLSMNALGDRAGLPVGNVSKIEAGLRGKRPSSKLVRQLSQALGVFPGWLEEGELDQGRIFVEDLSVAQERDKLRAQLDAALSEIATSKRQSSDASGARIRSIGSSIPPRKI